MRGTSEKSIACFPKIEQGPQPQYAIQIPRTIEASPPDPQMGEAGRPVDIAFWRADWQASVDGRPDSLTSLYPNAAIDHYPFEAKPLEPGSAAQQEAATRNAAIAHEDEDEIACDGTGGADV